MNRKSIIRKITKDRMRNKLFTVLTVLLVLVTVFSIKGTAYSMEKKEGNDTAMESYYKAVEKEYVEKVKHSLGEMGYATSGVMLTKIVSSNGSREYTVAIHHKRLKDNEADTSKVIAKLEGIELPVDGCSICVVTTN